MGQGNDPIKRALSFKGDSKNCILDYMKEEKLLDLMLYHLSRAKTHLNISLAFSIFGVLYIIISTAYFLTQKEPSILNLFLVWLIANVTYFAQTEARKEYDFHMEKYKKLKEEYEDFVSR